ncbi:hypothetical protein MAR_031408 [Mya arenaria]|uniref:Uncharacterized protein n=1 Tax=Mya arenaria TaxID=6604 RepID=A0ABY7F622_MYAAR|nr:hypothetical protein MAR_031408 [Mya arenaria]
MLTDTRCKRYVKNVLAYIKLRITSETIVVNIFRYTSYTIEYQMSSGFNSLTKLSEELHVKESHGSFNILLTYNWNRSCIIHTSIKSTGFVCAHSTMPWFVTL